MNKAWRAALALLLLLALAGSAAAQEGGARLQRSEKKTLFIFPIRYEGSAVDISEDRRDWAREEFFEVFVTSFERFEFVDLGDAENVDSFLVNADDWLLEHAQEIVQKRKDKHGRIQEAWVTLDDLKGAVENGFAFVPVFSRMIREVTEVEDEDDRILYKGTMRLEIYRTSDQSHLATVEGVSDGIGGLLGAMKMIAQARFQFGDSEEARDEHAFRTAVVGIYESLKKDVRSLDAFSLKAVAYDTEWNSFSMDLGRDFGVRLDRRYKVWSLTEEGKRNEMLAFGKVRQVEDERSRVQVLIGRPGPGDQVIEDPRFGLNLAPMVGVTPFRTRGFDRMGTVINLLDPNLVFDLPEDRDGNRALIGLQIEYNIAWISRVSELYLLAEGGWIPMQGMMAWQGMGGLRKKVYFRRLAVFGSVKLGGIGIDFFDTDIFDDDDVEKGDDITVVGVGADIGAELMLTPDVLLRGQIGYVGFPEQTVLIGYDLRDGDLKAATVTSAGLTFAFSISWTL